MRAERIERMRPVARAKRYYAVGLLACALALTIAEFERVPLFASLPLAPAAAFLFDRPCAESVS